MSHTYTSILIHIIFSTKERSPLLSPDMRLKLHPYLHGIARNLKATPLTIGGVEDHVHLFATVPPKLAISEFAGKLKANSSRWINETYRNRGRAGRKATARFLSAR
ncbi:MAG: IS200/IS605 family transposase [Planctomycetes bacterium]|nr:IS200/IS605 family transposase [Planctomycetota bacterium]